MGTGSGKGGGGAPAAYRGEFIRIRNAQGRIVVGTVTREATGSRAGQIVGPRSFGGTPRSTFRPEQVLNILNPVPPPGGGRRRRR